MNPERVSVAPERPSRASIPTLRASRAPILSFRPIQPSDLAELKRAFEALSPQSRYYRFHAPLRRLPDGLARYLTNVDGVDHVALVARERTPFSEQDVGIARFIHDRNRPGYAEAAITVIDQAQGRGVAQPLLQALAAHARWRGIHTFTMLVLRENRRAIRFITRLGALAQGTSGEVATWHLSVAAIAPISAPRSRDSFAA